MSSTTNAFAYLVQPSNSSSPNSSEGDKLWSASLTASSKKALDSRILYRDAGVTSLVSVGSEFVTKDANVRRELVRKAAGKAVGSFKDVASSGVEIKNVEVNDGGLDAHAAAVGAKLGLHLFTLKTKSEANPTKDVSVSPSPSTNKDAWTRGILFAEAQILARELMELPANLMTPTVFCERIKKEAEELANVEIIIRDEAWAAEKGMRTFLSVTKGTSEPAKLLELHYRGAADPSAQPLAFVGKGITFDSGGISLKPGPGMEEMRGDMGGAATVCSAALAIARLRLPINLVVVTPLCENMPGPSANKPGDIVYAMNGKSVQIDNTDAEGRLILSDALYYTSTTFKPHTLLDVATLTGAMQIALGEVYTGVFSTSDSLWAELHEAGEYEYDRFWRMPLDEDFGPQIYSSNADLRNTGGRLGGSCTAALFLKAFVEGIEEKDGKPASLRWAHVDIAGTMDVTRAGPYQYKGMTGRPVRALIEFATRLSKQTEQ